MHELIKELNTEIEKLRDLYINQTITEDLYDAISKNMVLIAINIYKDESIKFYIPCCEDGIEAVYEEEERYYVPIYASKEAINDLGIKNYREVTLKQLCSELYENIRNYSNHEAKKEISLDDLIENLQGILATKSYVNNNPKLSGIMYEPYTGHIYGFESWQVEAIMFKGMGVNSYTTIDIDTLKKVNNKSF